MNNHAQLLRRSFNTHKKIAIVKVVLGSNQPIAVVARLVPGKKTNLSIAL